MTGDSIEILYVEDDPHDIRLTLEALRDARIANRVHLAKDGEEALKFLYREHPYEHAPRPDFVILDMNLPKIEGKEVLAAMKNSDGLASIPVVILSSSDREQDVQMAYRNQVAAYIVKPVDADQYFTAIRSLKELWFNVIRLPRHQTQQV